MSAKLSILNGVVAAIAVWFGLFKPILIKNVEVTERPSPIESIEEASPLKEDEVSLRDVDGVATVVFDEKTFNFICNKAGSFDELAYWVKETGKDVLWIDVGFSEIDSLANTEARTHARVLENELSEVYFEQGWAVKNHIREDNSVYGVTKRGHKAKIPTIVSFFNPVDMKWIKSDDGLTRIGRAMIAAAFASENTDITYTIRGHRDAGKAVEVIEGYSETDYAFDLFSNMVGQLTRAESKDEFKRVKTTYKQSDIKIPSSPKPKPAKSAARCKT